MDLCVWLLLDKVESDVFVEVAVDSDGTTTCLRISEENESLEDGEIFDVLSW